MVFLKRYQDTLKNVVAIAINHSNEGLLTSNPHFDIKLLKPMLQNALSVQSDILNGF